MRGESERVKEWRVWCACTSLHHQQARWMHCASKQVLVRLPPTSFSPSIRFHLPSESENSWIRMDGAELSYKYYCNLFGFLHACDCREKCTRIAQIPLFIDYERKCTRASTVHFQQSTRLRLQYNEDRTKREFCEEKKNGKENQARRRHQAAAAGYCHGVN